MSIGSPPPSAAQLQGPLARVLRPLVRLFIRCGVTFPALSDLLRELYVNVAEYDFALEGKEQTDSRVSLLTGIHRKEVRRLRGAGAPVRTVPQSVSRTSAIASRWVSDVTFTDADGRPLPLRRNGSEPGDGPTFEMLVEGITRDVRPRAVLDDWIERKLVEVDGDGRLRIAEAAFAPRAGDERQLYYFGRNLHDHVAAAVENVLGAHPRFLERAVHYEGLSAELAETLERRSREIAMEALHQANREAQAAIAGDAGGNHRWNFGTYVFAEVDQPPAGSATAEHDARG